MTDWTISGALSASPGVGGALRTPRQRLEGSSLAASASVASLPIGWLTLAGKVRSQGVAPVADGIATHAFSITPDDVATFLPTRWVWVGGVGDLTVVMADGSTFTFSAIPSGTRLPISCIAVLSTGTSATSIVGTC